MPDIDNDIALYFLAACIVAAAIIGLSRGLAFAWFLRLPGILTHELLHVAVGHLTRAQPAGMSLVPRRLPDGRYLLGSAEFMNVTWYNAAFVGFAPVLCYPIAFWIVKIRAHHPIELIDIGLVFVVANLLLAGMPSVIDLRVATRSWPLALVAASGAWFALR